MPAAFHQNSELTSEPYDAATRAPLANMPERDNKGSQPEPKVRGSPSRDGTGQNVRPSTSTMDPNLQRLLKTYRIEAAASASSMVSTVLAFPLDSVKTRMQAHKYRGFVDCVTATYRKEGVKGFFRGVAAPMASIALVRTISFSIYQRSKKAYCDLLKRRFGVDVMGHVSSRGSYPNLWSVTTFGVAGATAGSCITLIACPFELTKLTSQLSVLLAEEKLPTPRSKEIVASYQNKGTIQTLKNIVKHRGYPGLYTGFGLHFGRDTLGTAIYFMAYESSKQLLTTFGGDGTHTNPLAILAAGGFCGMASFAVLYPLDTAKTNFQRNSLMYPRGTTVPRVPINFFTRDRYRGIGVSLARSCVVNAIFFSAFELLKKRIKKIGDE